MVDNFLRNIRTHVYLRQNDSYDIRRWLDERQLPSVINLMLPTMRTFDGLVLEDGNRVSMVRLLPFFETGTPDAVKLRTSRFEHIRNNLIGDWVRATGGIRQGKSNDVSRRVLVVPEAGGSALSALDRLECSLRSANIPVLRIDGSSLHDPSLALQMAVTYRFSSDIASAGVVMIDRLNLAPETSAAWLNLNGLISGCRFDTGISGYRVDLSGVSLIASYEAERQQRRGFPQVTRDRHGLPFLPTKIKEAFSILQPRRAAPAASVSSSHRARKEVA